MTRVKVKERNAAIRRGFDVLTSPALGFPRQGLPKVSQAHI